jgi:hypothetical protein
MQVVWYRQLPVLIQIADADFKTLVLIPQKKRKMTDCGRNYWEEKRYIGSQPHKELFNPNG